MEITKAAFTDMLMSEIPKGCQPCIGVQFRAHQLTQEVDTGTMLPDEAIESIQDYIEPAQGYPCLGQTALASCMGGRQCGRSPLVQVVG